MPGHYGKAMPKGKKMTAAMKKKMALEKLKKLKKKKYSAGQMRIARVAPPRDKITGADFAKLRKNGKKKGSKPVSRKR